MVKKSNAAKTHGLVSRSNPKIGNLKLSHDKTKIFKIKPQNMNVEAFDWQQNAKFRNKVGHVKFKPENGFCTNQKEISRRGQNMGALDEDPGVGGDRFAISSARACLFHLFVKKKAMLQSKMIYFQN